MPPPVEDEEPDLAEAVRLLRVLVPQVRSLRRSRWLARIAIGTSVALVIFVAVFVVVSAQTHHADLEQRAQRRADIEVQFRADCEADNRQSEKIKAGFEALIHVAVQPGDPRGAAAARDLRAEVADALGPARDCALEARHRAAGA